MLYSIASGHPGLKAGVLVVRELREKRSGKRSGKKTIVEKPPEKHERNASK